MYHGVMPSFFVIRSASLQTSTLAILIQQLALPMRSAILPKKDIAFPQKRNGNMLPRRYDNNLLVGADTVGMGARVFTPNYGDVSTTASVATKLPNGFGLYDYRWKRLEMV